MTVTITNRHRTSFGFAELRRTKLNSKEMLSSPRIPPKRRCPSSRLSRSELQESQDEKRKGAFQGCDKEPSHAKRVSGEEISIV